ncbi:hypothetical protein [Olleya sp. Bg11-27]|uniref:hypothetical protein n=1 Tax=Olleya sp. Bg11-27 TaxID=2058135 RepID=UPI000C312FF5|nr:hypothetical protein [Olleya sp. Bg11-27]AUC76069.1 hypothetical protein CW732_10510 [Olleya sp. Bg11-27]
MNIEKKTNKEVEILTTLVEKFFPSSGLPQFVDFDCEHIIMGSYLCHQSYKYEHIEYKNDRNSHKIVVYKRKEFQPLIEMKSREPLSAVLMIDNYILFGTAIYGDVINGQLFILNRTSGILKELTDNSRPIISIHKIDANSILVSTEKSLGYYESETQFFNLNITELINITDKLDYSELETKRNSNSNEALIEKLKSITKNVT